MVDKFHKKTEGFTLIELLIVVAIIGIIASIAVANLRRAKISANEAQAIGDTRSVISASSTYASSNCGFYGPTLTCLTRDDGTAICIPNYGAGAPSFLGGDVAQASPYVKGGYTRNYTGIGVAPVIDPAICDANSVLDYCYWPVPTIMVSTGVRSFSGIPSGAIFQDMSGAAIACPVPGGTSPLGS